VRLVVALGAPLSRFPLKGLLPFALYAAFPRSVGRPLLSCRLLRKLRHLAWSSGTAAI